MGVGPGVRIPFAPAESLRTIGPSAAERNRGEFRRPRPVGFGTTVQILSRGPRADSDGRYPDHFGESLLGRIFVHQPRAFMVRPFEPYMLLRARNRANFCSVAVVIKAAA